MQKMELLTYMLETSILPKPPVQDDDFAPLLQQNFHQFLQSHANKELLENLLKKDAHFSDISSDRQESVYCYAVAALQQFISVNWIGEESKCNEYIECSENMVSEILVGDGDSLVVSVKHSELLTIAKLILVDSISQDCNSLPLLLWALRCCCIVAMVLEERSDSLYKQSSNIVDQGLELDGDNTVKALFRLQCARHYCIYYKVKEAESLCDTAASLTGLSLTETGALGKRTKYQTRDIAQFCIDVVTNTDGNDKISDLNREELTRDIQLEDELRLNKIKFKESEREEREREVLLSGLQQAVLMCKYSCKVESIAVVDSLAAEEVFPYLAPILDNPQAWTLHLAALMARSKLESKEGKTVERSLAQMETCVESIKVGSKSIDRMRLVYVSTLPPTWELEKMLGKIMLSLGLTKAALDVFIRLEHWEEVIVCYTLLELRHKAAEVIKERLKEKETSRLWCLLGDATDDLSCYHKALELSNNKSARAYRSLGLHHYFNKDYSQCIPLFEKSLNLSSFQPLLILRLAFSSMEVENWELAAKSYRNYCSFEMDNFEAWNNLANCYVKLGQKERAWRVLQEAVRCDFDNWKVWDNLMVISVDIGAFNDVIRSYNRILDIKQTHIDNQVLRIIARAILENINDIEGNEAGKLKDKFQKLLARLTLGMPKEPVSWSVYGDIISDGATDQTEIVRGVQAYQKSLAAFTGNRGWERNLEMCQDVINLCLNLMSCVCNVTGAQHLQMSSSIRMSVSSASKLIKQAQTNISSGLVNESINDNLEHLNNELASLTERITKLRDGGC